MKKTLLDPKKNGEYPFRYVPAANTNIRETFKRVRESCVSCIGIGKIREEGETPAQDTWRKCLDCNGTGEILTPNVRHIARKQGGWVLSIFVTLPLTILAALVGIYLFMTLFYIFIAGSAV